jgi:hypothetical protein
MKSNTGTGLKEVTVPFDSPQLKIALVQLLDSSQAKPVAFVNGRETFVWISEDEVVLRRRKVQRVLERIAESHTQTNIVIFPEYTLPLESLIGDLQHFATAHGIVIIGGTDNIRSPRGKIYNQCPVIIPHHREPVWIRKRDLSQWETTRIDPARGPRSPIFTWKHQGQRYWFSVHICLDFLNALSEPMHAMSTPGVYFVPMCSPDVTTLRTFADSLLRAEAGRACVLCNSYGTLSSGNSAVMAVTPTGRALEPAIEIPRDGEFLLVFDLDCNRLVPPRKTPQKTITPLNAPWHLAKIVPSALGYDFRPEETDRRPLSIGIVNPEIFELKGVKMRLAFLQVPNYADVVDRNADKEFEILAILGQEDILVSHLAPNYYDFAFDIRQMAGSVASASVTPESSGQDQANGIPHFEVDTYFKVLGKEVTTEDRRAFRKGKADPSDDELKAVFALGDNWESTEVSPDTKRLFRDRRWILGDTRRVPGDISAIMTITLDQARHERMVFGLFEKEVLPEIVRRTEVTSVYGGSGRRIRIDYVLRITTDLKGLYPLIEFVHRAAGEHRIMATTTTYVVVHRIAALELDKACGGTEAGKGHFLNYHLWNRLESLEKRHFQELPEDEQRAIIRIFERAERLLLQLFGEPDEGFNSEIAKTIELMARALVTGRIEVFGDSYLKIHGATEGRLDELIEPAVRGGQFPTLASAIDLPAGKTRNKMTYAEKIRMVKVLVGTRSDLLITESVMEGLMDTSEVRNAFVHHRVGELTGDLLVNAIHSHAAFLGKLA